MWPFRWKILIVAATYVTEIAGLTSDDSKSLSQFAKVISCVTGRSALKYNHYGCFCGYGGAGVPVDEIDRCCQVHDECYGQVEALGLSPYWSRYSFRCFKGNAVCENNPKPLSVLCKCDVAAALCFGRNKYPAVKPKCPSKLKLVDV